MNFFAVCAPGLEPYLAQEMKQLGLTVAASGDDFGGVAFTGELLDLYRANLWLRSASRIQAQVGMDFVADSFARLHQKAAQLPWERYLLPGQAVGVHATSQGSRLSMKRDIARHVRRAIEARLGSAPSEDAANVEAQQSIVVRLVNDRCVIRMDSSGEHLHRRGYKLAVAKAPLRETLAAGMLLASGWDRRTPMLDPFCGSGTIPIEAALMGLNIAPGRKRRFQFQRWPGYDQAAWDKLLQEAESRRGTAPLKIYASDRDAGAVEMAQANALRAGVAEFVEFSHRAVSSLAPPAGPGWVATNPPYGERISAGKDLRNLYARFGDVLRAHCIDWRVAILCGDEALLRQTRLRFERKVALENGGIDVLLACGRVARLAKL
ncbi:MAG: THUMP domain-containing class I SAM-dependent RNA methyltransferase [Chloroflexota bacterium]